MENLQYFQGILQLRNCSEEIISFARQKVERENGVWIAKEKDVRGGIDFYISSNNFLRRLGRILKEKFKGVVKETSTLHTEDRQGKKLYRGTVLFRIPEFSVRDIGIFKGDEVKIMSLGNKVALKNMKTGKKKTYKFDEVNKFFRSS